MYPGLDADDMVRRGLFSSLMPFRRKTTRPTREQIPPVQLPPIHHPPVLQRPPSIPIPEVVVHSLPREEYHHPLPYAEERSQQDIFQEIVSECAHIERSTTTTPFSEGPTSPVPLMAPCPSPMMISPPSQLPPPPMMYPQCYEPMLHPHHHQHYAPPPYPTKDSYLQGPEYHQLPQMMMAPEQQGLPNAVLLEEVVKMVVSAMKQSSLTGGEDSPEEILRRKRNQNNEAAARYRKRQRAARLRAEEELHLLSQKNDILKNTVDHMEEEIQNLKQLVLQNRQS